MSALLRLAGHVTLLELRKATVFRAGFLVREVFRGTLKPVVLVFVFLAVYRAAGVTTLRGYTFPQMVHYMLLMATLHKFLFHNRVLDLSEQIFEGYVTKFLVMPFNFFALPLGRFFQYTLVQAGVAILFYLAGLVLVPGWWPKPAGPAELGACLLLLALGSYCLFLLFLCINLIAFWLDVVWTLLVASYFLCEFLSGALLPPALLPDGAYRALTWIFPYWTLAAPIEIFNGRIPLSALGQGLLVLGVSILALDRLRAWLWKRGIVKYAGAGM